MLFCNAREDRQGNDQQTEDEQQKNDTILIRFAQPLIRCHDLTRILVINISDLLYHFITFSEIHRLSDNPILLVLLRNYIDGQFGRLFHIITPGFRPQNPLLLA